MFFMWYCQAFPEIVLEGDLKRFLAAAVDSGDVDFTDFNTIHEVLRSREYCEHLSSNTKGLFSL